MTQAGLTLIYLNITTRSAVLAAKLSILIIRL